MNQKMFNIKFCFPISTGNVAVLPSHTALFLPLASQESKYFTEIHGKTSQQSITVYLEAWMDLGYCLTKFVHTQKDSGDITTCTPLSKLVAWCP